MSLARTHTAAFLAAGLFALSTACSGGGDSPSSQPAERAPAAKPAAEAPSKPAVVETEKAEMSPADLAARGKAIYIANCAACHNPDPAKEGALGPAVSGSSMELLEARILRAEYPPGYTPMRDSALMLKLPHLERELPALYAYLNEAS